MKATKVGLALVVLLLTGCGESYPRYERYCSDYVVVFDSVGDSLMSCNHEDSVKIYNPGELGEELRRQRIR